MLKAVLIDHQDSFTYNIKAWLKPCFSVDVIDADKIQTINPDKYDLIVLSPGPKTPSDYPASKKLLQNLTSKKPVLGICLGMQMMNEIEGGTVEPYYPPMHGKTSLINSVDKDYDQLLVARYHSLKCNITTNFEVIATSDNLPMIIRHKNKKWLGMQFHPESFLTEKPENFLQMVVRLCSH